MGYPGYFGTADDDWRTAQAKADELAAADKLRIETEQRDRDAAEEVRAAEARRQHAQEVAEGATKPQDERTQKILAAQALEAPLTEGAPQFNLATMKAFGAEMERRGLLFADDKELEAIAAALDKAGQKKDPRQPGQETDQGTDGTSLPGAGLAVASGLGVASVAADAAVAVGATAATTGVAAAIATKSLIEEGTELAAERDALQNWAKDEFKRRFPGEEPRHREGNVMNRDELEFVEQMRKGGEVRDEDKERLMKLALESMMNLSDKGDVIAAGRLKDLIEHNASPQQIAAGIMELDSAKHNIDLTIQLRNGKTMTIVNDGDGSPEVTVTEADKSQSYSMPQEDVFVDPSSGQSYTGRTAGLMRAMLGGGETRDAMYRSGRDGGPEGLRMMALFAPDSGGYNTSDPFKNTAVTMAMLEGITFEPQQQQGQSPTRSA